MVTLVPTFEDLILGEPELATEQQPSGAAAGSQQNQLDQTL